MTNPSNAADLQGLTAAEAREELMLGHLRSLKERCERGEATLRLLVGFLANLTETDGAFLQHRLARNLNICADRPDLAAQMALCDAHVIDPAMIRAVASVICGDGQGLGATPAAGPPAQLH